MTTTAVLSPVTQDAVVDLASTIFRKQVLPIGSIDYKGRRIQFDRQYLTDLASSFKNGAFDQVPFQFADQDNKHTLDPERYRGEVKGVELTQDGLDVVMELTPDAAELVRKNPKLGVSARIIEGLDRADGKTFPRAMQHVLGTLDPRITGMRPWQEVNLSHEVDETIDLSGEHFESEEDTMGEQNQEEEVQLSADAENEDVQRLFESLVFEDAGPATELSGGSDDSSEQLDLVRQQADAQRDELRGVQQELAEERFERYATELVDAGVPPAMLELARPVLAMPDAIVLDFTREGEDQHLDVKQVVRDMLAQTKGFVELAAERGHTFDLSEGDRDEAIATAWAQESPLG